MLASILKEAGYKTGLDTSPYINRFNERIQINGKSISNKTLSEITARVKKEADQMADHPTEFELVSAIAFTYFLETECEIVVLEVGLGGRLDYTNVIPLPEVAVITPISYDHMAILGDTLEKIAAEKAGIIKKGGTVVSSPQEPEAEKVLRRVCRENDAEISFVDVRDITVNENTLEGQKFSYKNHSNLEISLLGNYQPQNAAAVVTVVEQLRKKGWEIEESALRKGLKKTKWPARFEIMHKRPWVIVDGGHNPQCASVLIDNLQTYFPDKPVSFLIGVMADKDFKAMFDKVIPLAKKVFTVAPDSPRAMNAEELAGYFRAQGVREVRACESVKHGAEEIIKEANEEDIVCAFGSLYMSGELRKFFKSYTGGNCK